MHTAQLTINDYPVVVTFTYDEDDGLCIETVEAHLPSPDSPTVVDVSPLLGTRDFDDLEYQINANYDDILAAVKEDAL